MLKLKNYAKSTLSAGITDTADSFSIQTSDGAKFPDTGSGNTFRGVFWSASFGTPEQDAVREIVECYRASGDTFTISTRGVEGTTAKAWSDNDNFALVLTSGKVEELETAIAGKASTALNNLAATAINTSLISDTDSTDDLGSSSKYWANVYADKIYLDSDSTIINTDVDNFKTAYGWGNHASAGYLTSVTAHNLLSSTHGDTLADTVVRGDILIGNSTPKWARLAFPASPTGKVLIATATDVTWSASALGTAAYTASTAYKAAGTELVGTGGTGLTAIADGSILAANSANTLTAITWHSAGTKILTNTSGTISWETSTGATTALDNLASTAINTSLISDTDNTDDLGSGSKRWKDIHAVTLNAGTTAANTLKLRGYDVDGTTYVDVLTITSANTVLADLSSIVTRNGGKVILDADHTALQNVHGLNITAGQTLTVTSGGTIGSAAYTASTDYATSAQGTLATNAMPKSGGTFTGNVLFTDNTYDIGASGATRPKDLYLSGAIKQGAWNGTIITSAYGGTGNGFTKFTGPATAEKTFTLPNADATLLYSGGALGTPSSGTVTNLTGTASININGTVGATTPTTIVGTTIQANTGFVPDANDGAYLGTTALGFSDLFLASGGVINWANGNATLTHSTGLLTSNVPLSLGVSNALTCGTIEVGHASDTTIARVSAGVISVEGVTIDTISGTNTLTNKRINPRVVSAASYTTDTGTSLDVATCDEFVITAQAGALKFNNPSGTPVNGQKLIIRIKDNATARALTYDTYFRAIGVTLPTTTVISKTLYLGFIYNSDDTKWDCVAVAQEA